MSLKKESIQKIAALLKLPEADLTAAIESEEEKDVTIPEIHVFTAEELTARDESKVDEGKKTGSKSGETQGKELAVKEMKKAFGVEFDGKDLSKLVEVVKTQLGKGDDGLKQQIAQLQSTLTEKDKKIEEITVQAETAVFDSSLIAAFPAGRKSLEDGGFSDAEYLAALKANLTFEKTEAGMVVKKGGQILQDPKTYKPIPITEAINGYFAERKWTGENNVPSGRGGSGSGSGTKVTKLTEAMKDWEAKGLNTASAEFQQYVTKLVKENPEFQFDAV